GAANPAAVVITASATISGTVYNDANGNGAFDTGETGKSGVVVFLDTNNNGTADAGETTATTDASGNYSFGGLGAGTYHVSYTVPANWVNTGTRPVDVTVATGATSTGNNLFTEQSDASIAGTLYTATNGNGVLDGGESGKSGVTVFVDTNNNGTLDAGE